MPRYTLTPEEFAHIEKVRAKNATNLGYNEGLEIACQVIENFSHGDAAVPSAEWRTMLRQHLNSLKREITL